MTPLEARIRTLIGQNGPMSVADYFSICLADPQHGYYRARDPFGAAGDFTTAPEISQLFGEMIGIFLLLAWKAHGRPGNVRLIEIGPGRGTLMADVQRTIHGLSPPMAESASAHLVETSERLSDIQKKTLENAPITSSWHTDLDRIDSGFTLLFNNELFDAIAIRQFVRTEKDWRERVVGLDESGNLQLQAGPATIETPSWAADAKVGEIVEIAASREALMARIATRLVREGGLALSIDYGHEKSSAGDTLQAVSQHNYVDVLSDPGACDLTSHVDFEALAGAASATGAHIWPLLTQSDFLLSLGLLERAGALGADKPPETQNAIRQSVERLAAIGEGQMGSLFKVLCVAGDSTPLTPFAGSGV